MKIATPALGTVVLNLGPAARIPPGEGRSVRVGDRLIAVFRVRNGEVFVTDATCPHKGGPLADGTIGKRTIVCPLHACGFDLETGAAAGHSCGAVRSYPVEINDDGDVLVGVD